MDKYDLIGGTVVGVDMPLNKVHKIIIRDMNGEIYELDAGYRGMDERKWR